MSESSESIASIAPFVCKWLGAHSRSKRFNTQEELERHVFNDHDLFKLKDFYRGYLIYKCPWEDCEEQLIDISKVKEHLREHTQQRPFKCPICNCSPQFESLDRLNQHLIFNHNNRIVDSTGAADMTKQGKGAVDMTKQGKGNIAKSAKYDTEDEDYLICKALAKLYDRESYERLLVQYGLTDVIDADEFF